MRQLLTDAHRPLAGTRAAGDEGAVAGGGGSLLIGVGAMGLLWLSTVPLTNGTVATLFGVRNLSMLGGIVFFSHQIGSFLGVWLGGRLYDTTGSYDVVWWGAVALGIAAALLNLPIQEHRTPQRRAVAPIAKSA